MTLLVNGCSFSYGDELPDVNKRYSTYLGKHLNLDVKNIAWPGSSNERIWRTTKAALYEISDISKVFVMWSDLARVENVHLEANMVSHELSPNYVKETNNPLYDENGKFIMEDPFFQFSPARLNTMPWKVLKREDEDYYSKIYNTETGISKTFFYMYDILMTCKILNIDYYQAFFHEGNRYAIDKAFNQFNMNVKGSRLQRVKDYYSMYLQYFKGNQRIGFDSQSFTFNEFVTENKLDKMPQGHPGPKAHKAYAKYLFDNFMR